METDNPAVVKGGAENGFEPETFLADDFDPDPEVETEESAPVPRQFTVDSADSGRRLDVLLAERLPDISRSQLQRMMVLGQVRLNTSPAKASVKVQTGDILDVEASLLTVPSAIIPESIPLDIIYEDRDLLVINKAKGMVVHPAPGARTGTLVHALLAHCSDLSGIGGVERPGIVHRLDKETTGLIVVAKNDTAHISLQAQIQNRTASRKYIALLWGNPPFENAVIDVPISRHPTDRKRMAVAKGGGSNPGRVAITEVAVRQRLPSFTKVECTLQTGRTHQIRVHCAFAGFPVVGDPVYGGQRHLGSEQTRGQGRRLAEALAHLQGQALHAYHLSFDHPRTGKRLIFETPLPTEMQEFIAVAQDNRDAR